MDSEAAQAVCRFLKPLQSTRPPKAAGAALRGKERTYEGLFEKHAV